MSRTMCRPEIFKWAESISLPGTNTLADFAGLQVKAANLPIDDGRLDALPRLVEEEVVVPRVAVAQATKRALPEYS